MAGVRIDGNELAAEIRAEVREAAKGIAPKPHLVAVLVGDDPASKLYVGAKAKDCEDSGLRSTIHDLPASTSQADLLALIHTLNDDPDVDGILVQSPLPKGLDEREIVLNINPRKDVDCFHPENVGLMVIGQPRFLPCTPAGVQQILIRTGIDPKGKHVVVVGRSDIVGKPMVNIMLQKQEGANATVTVCHTGTVDMGEYTRQADILIVASGRPSTVTREMIKPGAVVINVGINQIDDPTRKSGKRFVGDVDLEACKDLASVYTGALNGVGPLTRAVLMQNTLKAATLRAG